MSRIPAFRRRKDQNPPVPVTEHPSVTAPEPEPPPADPASAENYIRRIVDKCPPLTVEQRERLALLLGGSPPPTGPSAGYADLYERHAQDLPPETSIGDGDFDRIGKIELAILIDAGLTPSSYLLDFGCGTGRLAVHAVPYLSEGEYLGTDISPTMLRHAGTLLRRTLGDVPDNVRFIVQPDTRFPTVAEPDMICAFSVFTHMEHEDSYRYLLDARTICGPDTLFVASCLPMETPIAHGIFLASAAQTLEQRWAGVRNVVTSQALFSEIAGLAGWDTVTWLAGEQPVTTLPDGSKAALGQSVVVLQPAP